MAYIDYNELQEYPFFGEFYRITIDRTLPPSQQIEEKEVILTTVCDVTESAHSVSSNFISAKFVVHMPFDKNNQVINIKNGDMFVANVYGMTVNGKVVGVFPSQLNGITIYIQDLDV